MQPATEESRERYANQSAQSAQKLRRLFRRLDTKGDGKIDHEELSAYLKSMAYTPKKGEVRDMIWEVDEDHDGCVGWLEFERAFLRCAADRAGTEPRQLHNVVLFALHAAPGAAKLSAEEATRLTYLQYGREALDAQLAATFGNSSTAISGAPVTSLTLTEFVRCMMQRHLRKRPPQQRPAAATRPLPS